MQLTTIKDKEYEILSMLCERESQTHPKGLFDKKIWKMIKKTIEFYEKMENEICNLVRHSQSFSLFFFMENFLTHYPEN